MTSAPSVVHESDLHVSDIEYQLTSVNLNVVNKRVVPKKHTDTFQVYQIVLSFFFLRSSISKLDRFILKNAVHLGRCDVEIDRR